MCSSRAFAKSAGNSSSGTSKCFQAVAGAICIVRILHCSVQKVQGVTPNCRLVNKLSDGIDLVEHLRSHHLAELAPQTRRDRPEIRPIKRLAN